MPRVAVPADVRGAILDAAARLMERHGYKGTTIDLIADEARIGKATIYGYFNSKEEVALTVMERWKQNLLATCQHILTTNEPADVQLRHMILADVLFKYDTIQRYERSIDEAMDALRHVMLPRREQFFEELARVIARVLEKGRTEGLFAYRDAHSCAHTVIDCVRSLSPYHLSASEIGKREDIEARANRVVDLLLCGLLAQKAKDEVSSAPASQVEGDPISSEHSAPEDGGDDGDGRPVPSE